MKGWIAAFIVGAVVLLHASLGTATATVTSDAGCPSRGAPASAEVDAPDFLSASGSEWKRFSLDLAIDARR